VLVRQGGAPSAPPCRRLRTSAALTRRTAWQIRT